MTTPPLTLTFVLGATGAGKTTFLDTVAREHLGQCHLIQVGKTLRAKYGEDYFKGQAAPEHTQEEAWDLLLDGVCYGVDMNIPHILVDGQPRTVEQVERIGHVFDCIEPGRSIKFLHLFAPLEIRTARVTQRDRTNEARYKLAMSRLQGDYEPLYYIVSKLCEIGCDVVHVDTSRVDYKPLSIFREEIL